MSLQAAPSSSTSSPAVSDSAGATSSGSFHRGWARKQPKLTTTTNLTFDANHDAFKSIRDLLDLLHKHKIPGPLLCRTRSEFSEEIGVGGQGVVKVPSDQYVQQLDVLTSAPYSEWSKVWSQGQERDACLQSWKACAIKQLRSKNRQLENEAASALREVRSLCTAKAWSRRSRYVVKLIGWGLCLDALESGQTALAKLPFLVLERADCDMEDFASSQENQDLSLDDRLRIAYEIGLGLHAIHNDGISHGDLKPSNILMFRQQQQGLERGASAPQRLEMGVSGRPYTVYSYHPRWSAKLCDFGTATECEDSETVGQYYGTDTWRPPETIGNSKAHLLRACDIFAYGLVVWAWSISLSAQSVKSPLRNLRADYVQRRLGEQFIYEMAEEQIVRAHGSRLDVSWLNAQQRLDEVGTRRKERSRSGAWGLLPTQLINPGTSKLFEADSVNRLLCALAIAVDDMPERRSRGQGQRQPWEFLSLQRLVEAPSIPQTFTKSATDTYRIRTHLRDTGQSPFFWTDGNNYLIQGSSFILKHVRRSLLRLYDSLPFLENSCKRQIVFRNVYRSFRRVFGEVSDWISDVHHIDHIFLPTLGETELEPLRQQLNFSQAEWGPSYVNADFMYALARVRSHFADECCWQTLFARDAALLEDLNQALEDVRRRSHSNALPWAFRQTSALDIPVEEHLAYFDFLHDRFADDDQRTLRLHVLLDKHFFLGITTESADVSRKPISMFQLYLRKLSYGPKALQICRHFRRLCAQDGIRDVCKYYYSGMFEGNAEMLDASDRNTCLHDAVRANSLYVVKHLIGSGFDISATDSKGRTALDLANSYRTGSSQNNSRYQIVYELSQRQQPRLARSGLPDGWQEILYGKGSAYIETSPAFAALEDDYVQTDEHVLVEQPLFNPAAYAVTFQKPVTGLFQNKTIALVERKLSETESESFVLNPTRFLRHYRDQDTAVVTAQSTEFDDEWFRKEALDTKNTTSGVEEASESTVNTMSRFNRMRVRPLFRPNPPINETFEIISFIVRSFFAFFVPIRTTWTAFVRSMFLLVFIPLALVAESQRWPVFTRLWLYLCGLSALRARIVYDGEVILKSTNLRSISSRILICGQETDIMVTAMTGCMDLAFAITLLWAPYHAKASAYIVGSILISNLLVFGSAMITAGIRYKESRLLSTATIPLLSTLGFGVFLHCLMTTLYMIFEGSAGFEYLDTIRILSLPAAIISLIIAAIFYVMLLWTHADLFDLYEEDDYIFGAGEVAESEIDAAPIPAMISAGTGFIIWTVAAKYCTSALTEIWSSHTHSSWSNGFEMFVLIPGIINLNTGARICKYAWYNRMDSARMRTIGASVNLIMIALPILIIVGRIKGSDVTYELHKLSTAFIFLQWVILKTCLRHSRSHYLLGLALLGAGAVFAFSAYVGPYSL